MRQSHLGVNSVGRIAAAVAAARSARLWDPSLKPPLRLGCQLRHRYSALNLSSRHQLRGKLPQRGVVTICLPEKKTPNHENKPNTAITADLKILNRTREMNSPPFFIGYEQFCLEKYELYFVICFSYESWWGRVYVWNICYCQSKYYVNKEIRYLSVVWDEAKSSWLTKTWCSHAMEFGFLGGPKRVCVLAFVVREAWNFRIERHVWCYGYGRLPTPRAQPALQRNLW